MASLERKLSAVICHSADHIDIVRDDLFQINLTSNDYIDCSGRKPYYTQWHDSIEAAVDEILLAMDKGMVERYGDRCKRVFHALVNS